jgi:F-type H+-transporting ATPase subunit b
MSEQNVISIDYTLLIQAGLFIVLMLVLNKIFFKPFLRFLDERQKKISGDEAEAARLQEAAEQRRIQCEEGLHQGQLQGLEEKGRIQDAGAHAGKQLLSTVQQEANTELRTIKVQIDLESQQALSELGRSHGAMAKKIAEKILGRNL